MMWVSPTSLSANDVNYAVDLFEEVCLTTENNVGRITQAARSSGLQEANLAADPTYKDMVVPGERYFVLSRSGRDQIIVSGVDAPVDPIGPSVICGVKAFDLSIEPVVLALGKMGFEFDPLPTPGGTAYFNNDQFRGSRAMLAITQFSIGRRSGVGLLMVQEKSL